MPQLFIISGCNGAGKTTASYTILPELLNVKEFVNADEIAKGLSPFQPEKVAIEAGRIMLGRLNDLIELQQDFAFETTLSSLTFVQLIRKAKAIGFTVHIVFFWLESVDLAIERVKIRVTEGGHDIPLETIIRRYNSGLKNFINLYQEIADDWTLFDNSEGQSLLVAEGIRKEKLTIFDKEKWQRIHKPYNR